MHLLLVIDCRLGAGGLGEKVERLVFILIDRHERLVDVTACTRPARDRDRPENQLGNRGGKNRMFADRFSDEARPEPPGVLARQTGPALIETLETKDASLQRM